MCHLTESSHKSLPPFFFFCDGSDGLAEEGGTVLLILFFSVYGAFCSP